MSTSIMRLPSVVIRTGLSRSTIYQQVADGSFPRPVQLGPRAVGWLANEVDEWIADRIAARPSVASVQIPDTAQMRTRTRSRSGSDYRTFMARASQKLGE